MRSVITKVPKIAGKTPPSVLASLGLGQVGPEVAEEQATAGHEPEPVWIVEADGLAEPDVGLLPRGDAVDQVAFSCSS